MTDVMRWRYGETNPVVSKPIASGTVIEIGDLLEMASDGTVDSRRAPYVEHRSGDHAKRISRHPSSAWPCSFPYP